MSFFHHIRSPKKPASDPNSLQDEAVGCNWSLTQNLFLFCVLNNLSGQAHEAYCALLRNLREEQTMTVLRWLLKHQALLTPKQVDFKPPES